MRFTRNWALSLIAAMVMAVPAAATPPHAIWITDRLFAATEDELLILRTINDNHGSHFTTQSDTFLLTISLTSRRVTQVAAVERVVDVHLGEADMDTTTFYPLEGAVNPYAERAKMGAAPRVDPVFSGVDGTVMQPTSLVLLEGEDVTHSIALPEMRQQIIASLEQTRAVLPVLYRPVGMDGDPFDPQTLNLMRDCVPDATIRPWAIESTPPALVRLACEDWDIGARWSLWVVVPAS